MKQLGIDIGSFSISSALLENGRVLQTTYEAHQGKLEEKLSGLLERYAGSGYHTLGLSRAQSALHKAASAEPAAAGLAREEVIDPVLAAIEGVRWLAPGVRNAMVMGGERFFLVYFDAGGRYVRHLGNPPCASGTGSFLEQQAERMGITCAELASRAAAHAGKTPDIATRCAVFAKSDIIHAMQEGYSLDAVAAGLCRGIARNLLDTLVKGRTLRPPLVLAGGVALNKKIADTIAELSGLAVSVPEPAACAGAVGAALLGEGRRTAAPAGAVGPGNAGRLDPGALFGGEKSMALLRPPLRLELSDYPDWERFTFSDEDGVEVMAESGRSRPAADAPVALGFDIGSTSTKSVVVDGQGEVIRGYYTRTRGEPVAAVQRLLHAMKKTCGGGLPPLLAAGVTGSGRDMVGTLFDADLVVNEITAHAAAARRLKPDVDTIIEIGGQDSKLTLLAHGAVSFSQMNYVCAAGTGSFIEEQAQRLGFSLEQLSAHALETRAPLTSDRCTVYMERDLSALLGEGYAPASLTASVLYSVRDNYLSKVVQRRPLGRVIVFQGATARNKALVAAFEESVKQPIFVSPYCHLTGAYGAALLAAAARAGRPITFAGAKEEILFSAETCELCANRCLLSVAGRDGRKTGWGMKCGRAYGERRARKKRLPLVAQRFESVARSLESAPAPGPRARETIILLDGLYNREYNPLWRLFLNRLGFSVRTERPSRTALTAGKRAVNSDFCAPMIMAHGLAAQAASAGAQPVFFPAIVNERGGEEPRAELFREKKTDSYFCYYSQYVPTILRSLPEGLRADKLIAPLVRFHDEDDTAIAAGIQHDLARVFPDITVEETAAAFSYARGKYREAKQAYRANAVLRRPPEPGKIRVVLVGRPYAVFDPVVGLFIPEELERLGAEVCWQDEIALPASAPENAFFQRMHWKYGQDVLRALDYAVRTEGVYPVYVSCFRCSPDSFLLSYAQEMMQEAGKPFLFLGLDELASGVGYVTRIEAAWHAFRNHWAAPSTGSGHVPSTGSVLSLSKDVADTFSAGDTVLIPNVSGLISRFWAECFNAAGFKGEVLDTGPEALNRGYAYVHGGECLPVAAIVGGMVEKMKRLRPDPEKTALYLPTLCMACNFPQFPIIAKNAAREAGFPELKVPLVNSMAQGDHLPGNLPVKLFEAGVTASLVYKLYFRRRPYEAAPGASDRALAESERLLAAAFGAGSDVRAAFERVVGLFRDVSVDASLPRRPRVALLGDFYVKYNETVNQRIHNLIMDAGGELVIPSFTEMTFHFFDVDARIRPEEERRLRVLRVFESRFEKLAVQIIGEEAEPDWKDCVRALEEYGLGHYLPGETALNTARALYCLKKRMVEAIVHINPMFCCPGVVSASLFRKISADYGVPIVDIFYDGTGDPNRVLVPHLHYLCAGKKKARG